MMSIVNLGLQCVGIMRTKGSDKFEQAIKNANNLNQLRESAHKFKEEYNKSIAAPKGLLASIMRRLELKGERFEVFESASEQEIEAFWEVLLSVDDCLQMTDTTQTALKDKTKLHELIKHCCQVRKYLFCVKKCGSPECTLCKPVRMDPELFKSIHFLPDPLIGEDNHYKCFSDVYGSTTTERDCPSSQSKAKKSLSFSPSKQHVLNVDTMVQCEECSMRRLLFSRKKLSVHDKKQLQDILADIEYMCGATLEELDLPDNLKSVVVHVHNCYDPCSGKVILFCRFTTYLHLLQQ